MKYGYEITARPAHAGGGWIVRLLKDGELVGGGAFPVGADPAAGMTWWNECSEQERAYWLMMSASARPADAYHAYLLAEEHASAEAFAEDWLDCQNIDQ